MLARYLSSCENITLVYRGSLNVTFTLTSEVTLTLVTVSPALPPSLISPPVIAHLSTI